jgi:hypothetical protein
MDTREPSTLLHPTRKSVNLMVRRELLDEQIRVELALVSALLLLLLPPNRLLLGLGKK